MVEEGGQGGQGAHAKGMAADDDDDDEEEEDEPAAEGRTAATFANQRQIQYH